MARTALVLACALLLACSNDAEPPVPSGSGGAGGAGGEAGGPVAMGCAAGTKPDGDACLDAGVPSDGCGEGFEWADGGCTPVLPPTPCLAGEMALPGETACRSVSECGTGRWGDIPLEADTLFVDAAYQGGDSDGSEDKPFTSIDYAVGQAQDGQHIAVAAGSYPDDIAVQNKQVRIWGRCAAMVEVAGEVDREISSLIVGAGADGSEFHGLAITGPEVGVVFSGSSGLVLDRVWVHDTGGMGVAAALDLGATEFTLRDSLVEVATQHGVWVDGAIATVEGTVVRDIAPLADGTDGEGIVSLQPADLAIRRSVVERARDNGVLVSGGSLVFEDSLLRDTAPQLADGVRGRGLAIQMGTDLEPAVAEVRRSVLSGNHEYALYVWSAQALVEHVTVRDTSSPAAAVPAGIGVAAIHAPDASDGAKLELRQSLVERSTQIGVHVSGSEATLEQVVIRDTSPDSTGRFGRGLQVQRRDLVAASSTVAVRWSRILRSYEAGAMVVDSAATFEGTLIADTEPNTVANLFGDGVVAIRISADTSATVTASRLESNARVGVASFGATVALTASTFECNAIQLNGEFFADTDYDFSDLGGNRCACGDAQDVCKVLSEKLEPPDVLP